MSGEIATLTTDAKNAFNSIYGNISALFGGSSLQTAGNAAPSAKTNWALIIGVIIGIIVLFILIGFLLRG